MLFVEKPYNKDELEKMGKRTVNDGELIKKGAKYINTDSGPVLEE